MIRFVAGPANEVIPDVQRKLPGRGMWVTAGRQFLQTAIEKDLFSRSLRKKVSAHSDLPDLVCNLLKAECLGLLSVAKKAGILISGFSKVEGLIRTDQVAVILHSSQAASDGKGKLQQALRVMELHETPMIGLFSGKDLDAAIGLENVTYLALTSGNLSEKFVSLVRRLEELGVGRPSTYASIIGTILDRGYVWKRGNPSVLILSWFR